ncbi:MAG: hypothetical protein WCT05_07150, partial [Lentisphaeria bacterium]
AVDAAAYAAALVQADTFSRVAAINKAMAWTWVQSTRLEMDYCFDKFLGYVLKEQRQTAQWAHDKNQDGNTNKGFPFWGVFGLRPYSSGAGQRGGRVANYEPEFTELGGAEVPDDDEIEAGDDSIGGMFSEKTEAEMQASEEAYRQLDLRKAALEKERDRLVEARNELQDRTPPHRPDPYNILSSGANWILLNAENASNCLSAATTAPPHACPDCLQWRSERNQYINDSQQLKRDYDAENKKYINTLKDNQDEMDSQVEVELEKQGGLGGLRGQLADLEEQLEEIESQLGNVADTVEFYELQIQGALGLFSDLKAILDEISQTASFYSSMKGVFLPPTIGINSHWMLSIWGSLKRILYRFENLDTMENLFPSLAIAGQRTRIMQMNDAIDTLLFDSSEGLQNRVWQTAFNVIRANISFSSGQNVYQHFTPSTYIQPYTKNPVDDKDPEPRFLALAGYTATPRKIFGRGWHTGNNKHGWYRRKDSKTLGRFYKQQNNMSANVSEWFFWSTRWLKIDLIIVKIIIPTYIGWGTESGNKQRDGNSWFSNQKSVGGDGFLTGTTALKKAGGMADWLRRDDLLVQRTWPRPHYFRNGKQWGNYNFSATAPVSNPFAFLGNAGWLKAFQIPNQIHVVAASTSGYRLPDESWAEGQTYSDASGNLLHSSLGYRTEQSDEGSMEAGKVDMQKLWNLRVTDWDALLMPEHSTGNNIDMLFPSIGGNKPIHKAPAGMSGNSSHDGGESKIGILGDQDRGAVFDYSGGRDILIH